MDTTMPDQVRVVDGSPRVPLHKFNRDKPSFAGAEEAAEKQQITNESQEKRPAGAEALLILQHLRHG
jgi:hypothetical protein